MLMFYRLTYRLSQCAAAVAAVAMLCMVAHIGLEIILRHFFSTSTYVMDEFVGYGLAIATIWSLGYTLEHGTMIRVTLATRHLPQNVQNWLLALCAFATAFCTASLTLAFLSRALRAWDRGTTSFSIAKVPMVIPEGMVTIGLAIFSLQLVAYGLRQLTGHDSFANIDPDHLAE